MPWDSSNFLNCSSFHSSFSAGSSNATLPPRLNTLSINTSALLNNLIEFFCFFFSFSRYAGPWMDLFKCCNGEWSVQTTETHVSAPGKCSTVACTFRPKQTWCGSFVTFGVSLWLRVTLLPTFTFAFAFTLSCGLWRVSTFSTFLCLLIWCSRLWLRCWLCLGLCRRVWETLGSLRIIIGIMCYGSLWIRLSLWLSLQVCTNRFFISIFSDFNQQILNFLHQPIPRTTVWSFTGIPDAIDATLQ